MPLCSVHGELGTEPRALTHQASLLPTEPHPNILWLQSASSVAAWNFLTLVVWALPFPRPTSKSVFLWIWTFLSTLKVLAEVPGWRVSLVCPVAAHYPDPA